MINVIRNYSPVCFLGTFLMMFLFVSCNDKSYLPSIGRAVRSDVKVLDEEDRGKYVCRLIEYAVEKGERIKAYLLVPDGADRYSQCPAIMMMHDHGARFDIGKEKLVRPVCSALPFGEEDHVAVSSRQWVDKYFDGVFLADSLASLGYVVLVADALYWGDRSSEEAVRWSELMYGLPEHYTLDLDRQADSRTRKAVLKDLKTAVYEGQRSVYDSLKDMGVIWAEKILRDDVASVRLLSDLPYVDKDRIGAFGFSMGAHRSWLLSAFCKDICCGVALSWMTTLDGYEGNNASDLSMRIQPMRDRMDFGDIGMYLAPKPMLFLSGETDHLFPKSMVQRAYDLLQSHYEGGPVRTEFFSGGHHCGKEVQILIADFFSENLN